MSRALIESEATTAPTRAALLARLAAPVTEPRFLESGAFATLRAVCARLLPGPAAIDIAGAIDTRLIRGEGDGWRYDSMPADGDAYAQGLAGIDRLTAERFGRSFVAASAAEQDAVLRATQTQAPRFFEELLAEAGELFFAHPLAQSAIGYAGYADFPGWTAIGLDEHDPREPPLP